MIKQSLARLILTKQFSIDPIWGLAKLAEISYQSESGFDFTKAVEASKLVDVYENGKYQGRMDQVEYISRGSIAKVNFSGVMMENDGWCAKGMTTYEKVFQELYADSRIAGILFSASTGGGESTAGDVLFNSIKDKNKPVLTHTSFLGSAGVKGTLASDEIMAASTSTIIGSIGVMTTVDKELLDYIKTVELNLYSEKSPNKNEEYNALLEGDFGPLIAKLTKIDEKFMDQVAQYRSLDPGLKDETLSGRTFLAEDAKQRGLIDSIGTVNDALNALQRHINYY